MNDTQAETVFLYEMTVCKINAYSSLEVFTEKIHSHLHIDDKYIRQVGKLLLWYSSPVHQPHHTRTTYTDA